MREIRLYGSEGGGAARSPYPYQIPGTMVKRSSMPGCAGMTIGPPGPLSRFPPSLPDVAFSWRAPTNTLKAWTEETLS